MSAIRVADYMGKMNWRAYICSDRKDVGKWLVHAIPRIESGELDLYWRSKKAMLKYFARCQEINPTCVCPNIIFISKLIPGYKGRPTGIVRLNHYWFEKGTIKRFSI
jgi:hypothetical protein